MRDKESSISRTGGEQLSMFEGHAPLGRVTVLGPGAQVLHGFAHAVAPTLIRDIASIVSEAPFRHMSTPGGLRMSVAMTNCGDYGWVTDRRGYRYEPRDPETGRAWPKMPVSFSALAIGAAREAGFCSFVPDACLINRYAPDARMSLHQDKDEHDLDAPIVSVSLGLLATFLFGGPERNDRTTRVRLEHGDVVVWGGPSRLHYHGVLALKHGEHPLLSAQRINLTFRKAK